MAGVAVRGIAAHRSRLVATILAVLLGVSFMCGTAILADTVQASFNEVFVDVYGRIDVVVRSDRSIGGGLGTRRTRLPSDLVDRLGAVPGVRAAEGQVEGTLRVLDARGKPMYNPQAGPPTVALNWLRTPELNGWTVLGGAGPATADEIVLDRRTAAEGGYRVGDRVRLVVAQGPIDRRLAGIATFSGLDTYSGSPAVLFETDEAQRLVGEPGRYDWVSVVADSAVGPDALADRVRTALGDRSAGAASPGAAATPSTAVTGPAVSEPPAAEPAGVDPPAAAATPSTAVGGPAVAEPPAADPSADPSDAAATPSTASVPARAAEPPVPTGPSTDPATPPEQVQVLTGQQLAKERQDFFGQFISLFTQLLSAFGLIALFVGAFLIFNTFAIIVGSRTRELALLRAVGASRRQILGSVVTEAVVVGLLSSLLGVIAGVGVARLLRVIIGAFGFELPDTPLRLVPTRALLPVTAGLVVTAVAAIIPALRAANTAPVAAMREATLDRPHHPIVRLAVSVPFFLLAGATAGRALHLDTDLAPGIALLAAVPAIGGLAVAGPVLAPPVATAAGAPLRWLTGITGRLASRNAVRNPTRTSSTACALVIGVALVCAIGVLAASLSATVERTVDRTIAGDYVVMSEGFSGISPTVAAALGRLPEVATAAGVRAGPIGVRMPTPPGGEGRPAGTGSAATASARDQPEGGGRQEFAVAADPAALAGIIELDVREGSLDRLAAGTVAVAADQARRDGVHVGDTLPVTFLIGGGRQVDVQVVAVYERALTRNGEYLFAYAGWDPNVAESARVDQRVLVALAPGVTSGQARPALERALADNPTAELLDVAQYRDRQVGQVTRRISYLYALLALAVLVGVLGIVNTLVLSVHERSREIGLMRAVGAHRRQVGTAVLQEAVLIAAPGAVFGVLFGVAIGWVVVGTVRFDQEVIFTVPVVGLALVAAGACVAGLLAGVYPATRAGRIALNDPSAMS
jgi:putative ABC transport system permease protein